MMTRSIFIEIKNEALDALLKGHICDALFMMDSLVKEVNNERITEQATEIRKAYDELLDETLIDDTYPQVEEKRQQFIERIYTIINQLDAHHRLTDPNDFYTSCFHLSEETDDDKLCLFCRIVNSRLDDGFDWKKIGRIIKKSDEPTRRWLFSALTLSLWSYFDIEAFKLLAHFSTNYARPVIALVYNMFWNKQYMLAFYPEVEKIYKQLWNDDFFAQYAMMAERFTYMSRVSEEVNKRLTEEVFPTLIEASRDERLRMGFEMDDDDDQPDFLKNQDFLSSQYADNAAENAELTEKIHNIHDSLNKLFEYSTQGYDLNVSNFNFIVKHPFFNEISNWFKPFDPHDAAVEPIIYPTEGKMLPLVKMLLLSRDMCDIDFYGVIMIMEEMKTIAGNMMNFIQLQSEEAESVPGADVEMKTMNEDEDTVNVIRALYRLCKKSKWKSYLKDIFGDDDFTIFGSKDFVPLNKVHLDHVKQMLQLYRKFKDSKRTHLYLSYLSQLQDGDDAALLIMRADQFIDDGNYEGAILSLQQADVLQPGDKDILWKMNYCCVKMHREEERLECLNELTELCSPDDTKVITEKGLCLMHLHRYEEAIQQFFHLILLEKSIVPAQRSIAWCSLCLHRFDQAHKYYLKVINTPSAATWEDYLHLGHSTWLLGDTNTAVSFYHQYMQRYLSEDIKRNNAFEPFMKEWALLREAGKSDTEINLLYDLLTRL